MKAERSSPLRILVIEDDAQTAKYIRDSLAAAGHEAIVQANGSEGMKYAVAGTFDVLVVDRMLPGADGITIVKSMRSAGVISPVLFLTSLGGVDDRVEGLEAGADDYVVKPFAPAELIARINALARRGSQAPTGTILRAADLQLDLISRKVTRAGQPIDLQPREFKLLEYLLRNQGRAVTRTMLLKDVWDFHFDPKTSIVETHISRLRDKIDKPFGSAIIQTVRGIGYMIDDAA